VHADVALQATEAARVVGLDMASVDISAVDVGRPLAEQRGAVVNVSARPDMAAFLQCAYAHGSRIGPAIVDHLFADGDTGRIPIVAITGVNGKTTVTRLMAHVLGEAGELVGMTCTDGIYIGERRIDDGDCSGPQSARMVLQNPKVTAAVLETARGGILREGLGFDCCDVAVVTNIGEGDHLGINAIDTVEQLAKVKATIVDVVAESGSAVLNANDPLVVAMAGRCPGMIIFFARDAAHPVVEDHRRTGGRAVFVRERHIVLAEGSRESRVIGLERVPLTHGGRIGFQVENVLAVVASAWSLGVDEVVLRRALERFGGRMNEAPGRFNLFEINGATVIVDYGHNASSLACMLETLNLFPRGRRVALYSTAGDRRDEDIVHQGTMLGEAFDHVFLYEDHYVRGRKSGEIMALFRRGLATGRRVQRIHEVTGHLKAIETVLAGVGRGDLLLLQADVIEETVKYLRQYLAQGHPGREIRMEEALQTSQTDLGNADLTSAALGAATP